MTDFVMFGTFQEASIYIHDRSITLFPVFVTLSVQYSTVIQQRVKKIKF